MDCRFSKAILRDICNKFIDVYFLDLYRCHASQFSSRLPDYISISTVYLSMKLLSTTAGLYHSSSLPKLFLPQQMSIIADCTKFVSSTVYLYQNPSLIPNLYNSIVTLTNLYNTYLYQMKCIFTETNATTTQHVSIIAHLYQTYFHLKQSISQFCLYCDLFLSWLISLVSTKLILSTWHKPLPIEPCSEKNPVRKAVRIRRVNRRINLPYGKSSGWCNMMQRVSNVLRAAWHILTTQKRRPLNLSGRAQGFSEVFSKGSSHLKSVSNFYRTSIELSPSFCNLCRSQLIPSLSLFLYSDVSILPTLSLSLLISTKLTSTKLNPFSFSTKDFKSA
jgi:hypothetical protein